MATQSECLVPAVPQWKPLSGKPEFQAHRIQVAPKAESCRRVVPYPAWKAKHSAPRLAQSGLC
jgi:hypothetical protein